MSSAINSAVGKTMSQSAGNVAGSSQAFGQNVGSSNVMGQSSGFMGLQRSLGSQCNL